MNRLREMIMQYCQKSCAYVSFTFKFDNVVYVSSFYQGPVPVNNGSGTTGGTRTTVWETTVQQI